MAESLEVKVAEVATLVAEVAKTVERLAENQQRMTESQHELENTKMASLNTVQAVQDDRLGRIEKIVYGVIAAVLFELLGIAGMIMWIVIANALKVPA